MKQGKKMDARMPELRNKLLVLQGEMTAKDFADKLGLSRQTVGFYLSGKRIPDAKTIEQICKRCNVSSDWLLGLSEARSLNPSAVDELGLPEKAISYFAGLKHSQNAELAETVYRITENDEFPALFFQINLYIAAIKAESIFKAIEEQEWNKYLLEKGADILSENVEDKIEKRIIRKTNEIAESGKYGEMVSISLKAHCQKYGYHSSSKEFRLFATGVHGTSLVDLSKYNVSVSLSKLLEKIKTETENESRSCTNRG